MEEENGRELRSSRSRSNTPLNRPSRDRESVHDSEEGNRVATSSQAKGRLRGGSRQKSTLTTVTESQSEVTVTTTRHVNKRTGNESDSSTERVAQDEQKGGRRSDRQKNKRKLMANGAMSKKDEVAHSSSSEKVKEEKLQKRKQERNTSDYSSEEGDGVAYHIYKQAGDWWNKFPKTDYTYSPYSHSRKEVAPGVIAMPNMSRRSLNEMRKHGISVSETNLASTATSSRHQKSKSHWIDHTNSGSHTSRKVLEDWAAVDSDVDEVAESFNRKSAAVVQNSWTITSYVLSVFTAIWTFITSSYTRTVDTAFRLAGYPRDGNVYTTPHGVSPVRSEGSASWLHRLFSACYMAVCSVMRLDTLLLSSWHNTQITEEQDDGFEEEDNAATSTTSKLLAPSNHKMWRLLLLLLPLLFLAGWLGMSEAADFSAAPIVTAMDVVKNAVIGWIFVPVEAFGALKDNMLTRWSSYELPPMLVPAETGESKENSPVDMELLARYIVASSEFEQQLALQVRAEAEAVKQGKEEQQNNANLLEEHRILLAQLTESVKEIQEKLDNVDAEAEKDRSWKSEWQHKWEEEKHSLKEDMISRQGDQVLLRKELRYLQSRLKLLQEQQTQIMRRCCLRQTPSAVVQGDVIEKHVMKVLADLLGATNGHYSGNPEDLRGWVSNMILAKEDLEARLANLTVTLHQDTREVVQRSKDVIMATVKEVIQKEFAKWQEQVHQHQVQAAVKTNLGTWTSSNNSLGSLSDLQVRAIVEEALAKYDADKTGLVDYALESSGGSIVSTRCTETYQAKTAQIYFFGIPLWYPSNNPRSVIQPGVHPGECWAFSGSQGFLVIKLSGLVQISAFSIEHIPRALSPHGRIDSAPKDFSVWGLKEETDTEPVLLGKYSYQENGTSLQNFIVQPSDPGPFDIVELRIESNHGNMEYTCLYRFRVHGVLVSK